MVEPWVDCIEAPTEFSARVLRAGTLAGLACETKVSAGTSFTTFQLAPVEVCGTPAAGVSGITCARFSGVLLPRSSGFVGTIATVLPERTNVAVTGWNLTGTLPLLNPVGVHSQPIPGWKSQPP